MLEKYLSMDVVIYEYKNLNQQYVFVIELVQLFLLFWATILHLWVQLQTNTG